MRPLESTHWGFASTRTRGRRRGPIPAVCHRYSSPVWLIEAALRRRAAVAARYRRCVSIRARRYCPWRHEIQGGCVSLREGKAEPPEAKETSLS